MNKGLRHFMHLLQWDFLFSFKYQLLAISLLITGLYWAVFQGLKSFGSDTMLMLVLYNDPVLLGMLFGGLMLITDRNQFTIGALAISPVAIEYYIFSKLLVLNLLGLFLSVLLWLLIKGNLENPLLFAANIMLISAFFTLLGFWLGLRQTVFLRFIIQMIGCFLILVIPFLGYFNVLPESFTLWMPLGLSLALFKSDLSAWQALFSLLGLLFWDALLLLLLLRRIRRFGWT